MKVRIKPLIKFVGGKRWFVRNHCDLLPKDIENYFEPFLGSGAIYTHLKSRSLIKGNSYLSDINNEIIVTFNELKNNPHGVIDDFINFKQNKEEYYNVRNRIPISTKETAVRFLYLNRFSFGGLYRVNQRGEFNVPYGNRVYKNIIDVNNIIELSKLLNHKTQITSCEFSNIELVPNKNNFYCLDPPYLDKTTKFRRYNSKVFNNTDILRLKDLIKGINKINAKYLLFVGDNIELANAFKKDGNIVTLSRSNNLSAQKSIKSELIIKNY